MRVRRYLAILTASLFAAVVSLVIGVSSASAEVERCSARERIEGRVVALASSVRQEAGAVSEPPSLSILLRTDDGLLSVTLAADVEVRGADGRTILANAIPPSARVRVEGRRLDDHGFEATAIEILP